MLVIVFLVLIVLLAPFLWHFWPLMFRASLSGDFRPSLYRRVERVLAPHEGRAASPEVLTELQREIETVVRDTLIDLHQSSDGLAVLVRNDDVLGPVCFIQTPEGAELSLAAFEASLG